jgi:hypothetical protein
MTYATPNYIAKIVGMLLTARPLQSPMLQSKNPVLQP